MFRVFGDLNREKTFISRMDGNKKEFFTTSKKGNLFSARTKDLGKFFLEVDTIAPKILPPEF